MAETTPVAQRAAPLPDPADIARAEAFTRERYVHDGEDPAVALAPGTPRRLALDQALAELDAGATVPSTEWRRRWSLLLGLERLLSEDEPRLADGTLLNPHQVDALSGTLTALLAEAMREANGNSSQNGQAAAPVLAVDEEPAAEAEPDGAGDEDEDVDEDEDEDEETSAEEEPDEREWEDDPADEDVDEDVTGEAEDDPNAFKRFWFEHATGAGKTVAALGFVEASRTGGVLILTHRRNLVDQFNDELTQRGYANRICKPLLDGEDRADGPVTVETYQWFVRNAGNISSAYTIVICDEAHTALGEKTSSAIRAWTGPVFIGMTATGALIARHVTDLFPTQTSRFDLGQAARRGVISPLRSVRIPPGPGVRTIAKVPLRRGEVDTEFDQELLAELLDQLPFNLAVANLYKTRFNGVPGVVYAAGVRHAYNVAEAFRDEGMKAEGVSGETPKRELAEILARYERGDIDVLVNAQLLAEGWNSPRATVCMHLAPTASKRIYQQRVGRVTRRHPGKEAGIVVDFVHPATKHDDPVVTLHSLLDREVYRGGAIVVGPVRRGRGRRVRVERRVLPVVADENRRIEVFERELWRIAVEHLDYGEQIQWAALAGARVAPSGWRRARAMLHFDRSGELKRTFLLTAVQRNRNSQLRIRALQEIAAIKDAEAFDLAIDEIGRWSRDERREGTKVMLQALAEKRIGRRDQANAWIWRLAEFTRDVHEEYAVQRWPETKRLLGLLVNSSGGAHARNARRLVHAARKQDRRLSAALLAAALAHTPEAEEVLRGARTRMARKPSALSRELLRNFPKRGGKSRGSRRRKKKGAGEAGAAEAQGVEVVETLELTEGAEPGVEEAVEAALDAAEPGTSDEDVVEAVEAAAAELKISDEEVIEAVQAAAAELAIARAAGGGDQARPRRRRRQSRKAAAEPADEQLSLGPDASEAEEAPKPKPRHTTRKAAAAEQEPAEARSAADAGEAEEAPEPKRRRTTRKTAAAEQEPAEAAVADDASDATEAPKPKRRRTSTKPAAADQEPAEAGVASDAGDAGEVPKPTRRRTTKKAAAADQEPAEAGVAGDAGEAEEAPKPKRRRATTKAAAADQEPAEAGVAGDAGEAEEAPKPKRRRATTKAAAADQEPAEAGVAGDASEAEEAPKPKRRRTTKKAADASPEDSPGEPVAVAGTDGDADAEPPKPKPRRRTTRAKKAEAEPESQGAEADEEQSAA